MNGSDDKEAEALQPASSSQGLGNVSCTARDLPTQPEFPVDDPPFPFFLTPNFSLPISSIHIPSRVVTSSIHLNYLTAYLHASIRSLALQNCTVFIHHSFLANPITPSLQSARSICALSTLESPSTFSILDSYLRTLVASSNTTFYSPTAILHSVQALIIFQIVRHFSSNQQQIFHAETDFPRLNTWTIALQTAYFSLSSSSTSHTDWILEESIRRTILTSVLLRSLYSTTKDGYTELFPC